MQVEEPRLYGISKNEIQEILERTLKNFKEAKTRIIHLDASYIYNFHLDDYPIIQKFNKLCRYDLNAVLEWHKILEMWYQDQTVILADRTIKPIKISRTFDRVVNEGLEYVAGCIISEGLEGFNWRAIGDGDTDEALPSDKTMVHQIDRINVLETIEGGSLSRDGSTVYSIGNHAKEVETTDITECGMFDVESTANDRMFDHSVFEDPISHVQNADAVGSTTIIYMCSA